MTITSQEIPREMWRPYFEELTDGLGTVAGTVEVIGRDIGDQIADVRAATPLTRAACVLCLAL